MSGLSKIEKLQAKIRPWLPFTTLNTVWRYINKVDGAQILDCGCGKGEPMRFINRDKRFYTVGVDIFEPYLKTCKMLNIHNEYILCDVCKLPFKDKSFDAVICLEVIEHLSEIEGNILIKEVERVASKQIIFGTPIGDYKQDPFDGNEFQEHKYMWSPKQMKQNGYIVRGIGLRGLGGKSGIQSPVPTIMRPLVNVIWVCAGLFTYFIPELAGEQVCIKYLY